MSTASSSSPHRTEREPRHGGPASLSLSVGAAITCIVAAAATYLALSNSLEPVQGAYGIDRPASLALQEH